MTLITPNSLPRTQTKTPFWVTTEITPKLLFEQLLPHEINPDYAAFDPETNEAEFTNFANIVEWRNHFSREVSQVTWCRLENLTGHLSFTSKYAIITHSQNGEMLSGCSINLTGDGCTYLLEMWRRCPRNLKSIPENTTTYELVLHEGTFVSVAQENDRVKIVSSPRGHGHHYIGLEGVVVSATEKDGKTTLKLKTVKLPENISVDACDVEILSN